jgi:Dyp-type peroxidase family
MTTLELDDIQGFIARGYGNLKAARYLVLRVEDAAAARTWLSKIAGTVTPGDVKPSDTALHVAFTAEGLRALGLHEESLETFSREFWEGMAEPHRARHVLGDRGESSPEKWRWGGADTHILLLLFTLDDQALEERHQELRDGFRGVTETHALDTFSFERTLEHFGFNDGIAQPVIEGLSRTGPPENTIPPGEFILGYPNAYGKIPLSPNVLATRDPDGLLPRATLEDGVHVGDLGRNGSYLVVRQLSQDVRAFWGFIDEAVRLSAGRSGPEQRVRMAAKMVGRWPSGAPLTLCPEADDESQGVRDDFGYRATDEHGHFCPRGAHIRRTNPRDALPGDPKESTKVSNRHRLLRRGRPYGAPLSRSMDVDEILRSEAEHGEVGLHFICMNTDISRQFEFVQHTWINNAKFDGLYTDADPLMGHYEELQGTFTMQGVPVRQRITGTKRFVETRGGAYFFLPGLRALRYLSSP